MTVKSQIMPAHKNHTKTFAELTNAEQAKSITAMINNLAAAIRRHVRTSHRPAVTRAKCQRQVDRMRSRI